MDERVRGRGVITRCVRSFALLAAAALALSACGGGDSGSGQAERLLQQTFNGTHRVASGNLSFALTVAPVGSSTARPISVSFGGPFQALAPDRLPASDFSISFSARGARASLGILSTGKRGYVTLQGAGYELPPATFHELESSFAQMSASPSAAGATGALSRLGIHPERWLSDPSVVGSERIGGAETTHVHAGIDVGALLLDLATVLRRGSAVGGSAAGIPAGIPLATRQRIAAAIERPTLDVWTGRSDKILRRLSIELTLPARGRLSALLGSARAARIALTLQYAHLNEPQHISAPRTVRPLRALAPRLRRLLAALRRGVGGQSGR